MTAAPAEVSCSKASMAAWIGSEQVPCTAIALKEAPEEVVVPAR